MEQSPTSPPDGDALQEAADEVIVVDLQLGDFDSHGTTRAHFAGRWIEVEHGIPGEIVRAEIRGSRRPRGHILEILEPSPDRIEPPCVYFRDWACGGCQWQHIAYESQLGRKRAAVDAEMSDAGLSVAVGVEHALQEPWRYRSTAGISLGRSAGFRRHGSLAIVPIRDCPISHPRIGELMAWLNDRIQAGELADFRGRVRLEVRVAMPSADGAFLQVLVRPDPDRLPEPADLKRLTSSLAGLESVAGVSLERRNGSQEQISGERFVATQVHGRPIALPAGVFFQTNLALLERLIDRVRGEAGDVSGKRVADVYGGAGVFGLFLAEGAREVVVIESEPPAVEAGERTAAQWGLSNVRFVSGLAEETLPALEGFDIVVLDPPRTGLSEPVLAVLMQQRPPLILYVSCLARSLARDLQPLADAGYEIQGLELFDFYPQTYHVELLAVLRLR